MTKQLEEIKKMVTELEQLSQKIIDLHLNLGLNQELSTEEENTNERIMSTENGWISSRDVTIQTTRATSIMVIKISLCAMNG
jgi:hypothetical protein